MGSSDTQSSSSSGASPRLPSPPPITEVQIAPPPLLSPPPSSRSPPLLPPEAAAAHSNSNSNSNSINPTTTTTTAAATGINSATRRIRPGTKSRSILTGPPPTSLSELDSAFQLQEHLASLVASVTATESGEATTPVTRDAAEKLATPPDGIEESLWCYELTRRLTRDLNVLIVALLNDNCTAASCPEMRASEWQYLCAVHESPQSCCAIDYSTHTLDQAATMLTSTKYFPSRLSLQAASVKHLASIFRRLYRIFAHAWFQHRHCFWEVEGEFGLYVFFKTVSDRYHLIPEDNLTLPPEAEGLSSASAIYPESEEEEEYNEFDRGFGGGGGGKGALELGLAREEGRHGDDDDDEEEDDDDYPDSEDSESDEGLDEIDQAEKDATTNAGQEQEQEQGGADQGSVLPLVTEDIKIEEKEVAVDAEKEEEGQGQGQGAKDESLQDVGGANNVVELERQPSPVEGQEAEKAQELEPAQAQEQEQASGGIAEGDEAAAPPAYEGQPTEKPAEDGAAVENEPAAEVKPEPESEPKTEPEATAEPKEEETPKADESVSEGNGDGEHKG